jgi:four helix bundle protein
MTPEELKRRTQQFALRIFRLVEALPKTFAGKAVAMQLVRSGSSIGANYRAACRGRSRAEFRAKLGVVVEEADESVYWLELIIAGGMLSASKVRPLLAEANELCAIMVASRKSAEKREG